MAWLAAIPDLLTAAGFLLIWLRTDLTGPEWVATGVATLLLEFFVVLASGFFAVVMFGEGSRLQRSLFLVGIASACLLLVTGYAWALHAWWMVGTFVWLTFGKVLTVWRSPATADRDLQQSAAIVAWAASVVCYLGAVIASAMVDWPAFGVTPDVRTAAGFTGGGEWEVQPYRALAGGVLYFSVMAVARSLIRARLLRQPQSSKPPSDLWWLRSK